MCGPKGYGFLAALVRSRVSIMLITNRVWYLHRSSLESFLEAVVSSLSVGPSMPSTSVRNS